MFIPDTVDYLPVYKLYICIDRKFFKQEREVREEISRMSSRPLFKVHEEMASLCQTFTAVTSELQRNARAITRLKQDTSQVCFLYFVQNFICIIL